MSLAEYVIAFAVRGACTCRRCCDASDKPEDKQPDGHTIDLTFFKVAAEKDANAEDFRSLVEAEFPHWLDGKEHNYLQCGGDIGDQGICLMAFGLGHLLGVWKCLCPETMMPFLPADMKQQMAGRGMIAINSEPEKAK
jgi:hypothetical protein